MTEITEAVPVTAEDVFAGAAAVVPPQMRQPAATEPRCYSADSRVSIHLGDVDIEVAQACATASSWWVTFRADRHEIALWGDPADVRRALADALARLDDGVAAYDRQSAAAVSSEPF